MIFPSRPSSTKQLRAFNEVKYRGAGNAWRVAAYKSRDDINEWSWSSARSLLFITVLPRVAVGGLTPSPPNLHTWTGHPYHVRGKDSWSILLGQYRKSLIFVRLNKPVKYKTTFLTKTDISDVLQMSEDVFRLMQTFGDIQRRFPT